MEAGIKKRFLLPVLIGALGLVPVVCGTAQTFATLHSFTNGNGGAAPYGRLILAGNTLYGTTSGGGSSGGGTVFAIKTDGSGFTNLHSFTCSSDGCGPPAGLILAGNTLYGTTFTGGSSGRGTVFAVATDGTGFTNLHNFAGYPSDGSNPQAGLILAGSTLYGTTPAGGSSGEGNVFAFDTDGTNFTNLYSFSAVLDFRPYTNSDGANPYDGLVFAGNTLYGTTHLAGGFNYGTVFALRVDGTGFTNLHSFSEEANPYAGLVLSGNTLYGTTFVGGSSGGGTVFALNTDGTGFTTLHDFDYSDGGNLYAGLVLSSNTLHGTAYGGGSSGYGTVFALNTDGTGFTNVYHFTGGSDGGNPRAGLILSGYTLYGTTVGGGASGAGTVFSLSFMPQLTITPFGTNIILTWPTNIAGFDYAGFSLQSTTNILLQDAWTAVSPDAAIVNGRNTVTNAVSGGKKFYRLSQ